eukprot:4934162-Heterocapsa_arctica.AAC.1
MVAAAASTGYPPHRRRDPIALDAIPDGVYDDDDASFYALLDELMGEGEGGVLPCVDADHGGVQAQQ